MSSLDNVKVKIDADCPGGGMLEIKINGDEFFHGNFWDFNRAHDIVGLLKCLNVNLTVENVEYDQW